MVPVLVFDLFLSRGVAGPTEPSRDVVESMEEHFEGLLDAIMPDHVHDH